MELDVKFHRTFFPLHFESFTNFWECLNRFQKENGFIYTLKNADKIRADSELARKLVYERIHFVCSYHSPYPNGKIGKLINCPSYILLKLSGNKLKIDSFDMHHNDSHANNALLSENDAIDKYNLSAYDLTREFSEFFGSHEFPTFEDLSDRMRQFEVATGALYVKLNSKRFPESHPMRDSLVYSNIKFVCYHYGTCVSCATKRVNQRTSKLGCSSQLCVNYSNGRLRIISYDMRHNHPVTPESARLYPRNRRLEEHEQKVVDELLRLPYDNSLVVEIIKKQFGKHCTKTDIKNMRSRLRKQSNNHQLIPHDNDHKNQLEAILQEIREVAETSNDELLTQNASALRRILSAWKQGRVATISEECSPSEPNSSSSYQNVFGDDPNSLMIDYNSPAYLMPNDTQ